MTSQGLGGNDAVLLVDPSSAESQYVANYYRAARDIPAPRSLYFDPAASRYSDLVTSEVPGFLGAIDQRGLRSSVEQVILMPGSGYRIFAPDLITGGCSAPVRFFAISAAYTLSKQAGLLAAGGVPVSRANRYSKSSFSAYDPFGFDGDVRWDNGLPSNSATAEDYFIATLLGYTGNRGNTVSEVLAMIDRSVAVEGTFPSGTAYYMQTSGIRSSVRHSLYPTAVSEMSAVGGTAEHLFQALPLGRHDVLGIMMGQANVDIDGGDFTMLPGSFAEHLTSFAGHFDTGSQTKMSRWIAKGASGTCGTVQEPCANSGKFPHPRIHTNYRSGLSLGESWFRSLRWYPFENLFTGDPLTRPYAKPPTILASWPANGQVSGIFRTRISARAGVPGAGIARVEVFVDGRLVQTLAPGVGLELDTTAIADGWHDVRLRAVDDTVIGHKGERKLPLFVVNHPGVVQLRLLRLATVGQPTHLGSQIVANVRFTGPDEPREVRLWHAGRIIAGGSPKDRLSFFGQNVGAGTVKVQAEMVFSNRSEWSEPQSVTVAFTQPTPPTEIVRAWSYRRTLDATRCAVVELPALFNHDPSTMTWQILQGPTQSTILSDSGRPYLVLEPNANAQGFDAIEFRVRTPSGTLSPSAKILIDWQ